MTGDPSFDQKNQSAQNQTNINKAEQVIIKSSGSVAAPIVPQQIRCPPADFKGREDEIRDIIEKVDSGESAIGLRGLGGIGKTALALVLGNMLKDRFPDGQLFLNMQGMSNSPLKPEDAMAHIIRSYWGTDVSLPLDFNGLAGLYNSVLSEKKSLILLDNVSGREQIESLLPPAGSVLLVTSRDKFALTGLKETDLGVLPLEDSKKLLLEIADRIGKNAEDLANLCGCLPLALENAAYALKEKRNISAEDYLERLKDARMRLKLVDASFSLSYELLTPEPQRLWSLLSVFPADFDLAGAEAVWKMEPAPAEEALGELVKWSLVDFLPTAFGERGRYRLHDLARVFADSRLGADAREPAQQRYAKHYQELLWKANELFRLGGDSPSNGLILFDTDWVNIQAGQEWARINAAKSLEIAEICSNFAWTGTILDLRLHPLRIIEWLEAALVASRKTENQNAEGAHLGNLGNIYIHLGEPRKAIKCNEKALKIARTIGDRRGVGANLGNLGNAYFHLGKPRKAMKYYEKALKIAHAIGDRRNEGTILGYLGNVYFHLGKPRKAMKYYERALKIAREIGDRRGEINHLSGLGNAYLQLGELPKAIGYYEKALEIACKIGDWRGKRNNLGSLGNAYLKLEEPSMAIEYYEKALKISHDIGDRRGEGADLGNLGHAYSDLGKPGKAMEYYEKALKISREIEDPLVEGICLFNMSRCIDRLDQRAKAIDLAKSALELFKQIESPNAEIVQKQLDEWQK
jgi:tetratricopeptide (TPR) repeat protein